jgi:hypothetical protein
MPVVGDSTVSTSEALVRNDESSLSAPGEGDAGDSVSEDLIAIDQSVLSVTSAEVNIVGEAKIETKVITKSQAPLTFMEKMKQITAKLMFSVTQTSELRESLSTSNALAPSTDSVERTTAAPDVVTRSAETDVGRQEPTAADLKARNILSDLTKETKVPIALTAQTSHDSERSGPKAVAEIPGELHGLSNESTPNAGASQENDARKDTASDMADNEEDVKHIESLFSNEETISAVRSSQVPLDNSPAIIRSSVFDYKPSQEPLDNSPAIVRSSTVFGTERYHEGSRDTCGPAAEWCVPKGFKVEVRVPKVDEILGTSVQMHEALSVRTVLKVSDDSSDIETSGASKSTDVEPKEDSVEEESDTTPTKPTMQVSGAQGHTTSAETLGSSVSKRKATELLLALRSPKSPRRKLVVPEDEVRHQIHPIETVSKPAADDMQLEEEEAVFFSLEDEVSGSDKEYDPNAVDASENGDEDQDAHFQLLDEECDMPCKCI